MQDLTAPSATRLAATAAEPDPASGQMANLARTMVFLTSTTISSPVSPGRCPLPEKAQPAAFSWRACATSRNASMNAASRRDGVRGSETPGVEARDGEVAPAGEA